MRTCYFRLVYGHCWQTALGQYITKELEGTIWHLISIYSSASKENATLPSHANVKLNVRTADGIKKWNMSVKPKITLMN